ncbi:Glycosyl transferases group 1 [Tropicimonas sediminicola]|uniref:Glycosyl transferases group 1 n=2 Tax=Tropicimonas sediminicola TaxID=1031541 RepID=A0A239M2C1_9RHOB|nr:Glycosyl transferases group 1 [Tropicimonas sediminicola]
MDALRDSDYSRNRKDEEIDGADRILVASSFSRSALRKHPNTELAVSAVPYGAPPPKVERCANKANGQPIEIVFAGRLSQSKGVADLIAALLLLDVDWHATIAGSMPQVVPTDLAAFIARKNVTYLGFVTHEVLLDTLSRAHVFVFPSLYEGFGMVLTEAMACGLPIISTPNTAAPDLITDGTEGFIVPIRDPDAIAERITRLAEDEDMRQSMAASALVLAERSPWSDYEAEIAGIVARELAL